MSLCFPEKLKWCLIEQVSQRVEYGTVLLFLETEGCKNVPVLPSVVVGTLCRQPGRLVTETQSPTYCPTPLAAQE